MREATGLATGAPFTVASPRRRTYILARTGHNHQGRLDQAKRLVDAAMQAGCDGIRFDKRTPGQRTVRTVLDRPLHKFPQYGRTVREVMERLELSTQDLQELEEYCKGRIEFILAPYDLPALEATVTIPCSGVMLDATAANNWPLVDEIARVHPRVFAATGLLGEEEITELVDVLGSCDLTLLHSILLNPFEANLAFLSLMTWLERFGRPIGYTDNEPGVTMVLGALTLGARVIEKSLTLDRDVEVPNGGGLSPAEMARLVRIVRETEKEPLSQIRTRLLAAQREWFDDEQVSVVAACPIAAGTVLSGDMLTLKTPYRGLSPWRTADIIGKRVLYDLEPDDFITYGVLDA